jgi:hypothetical protein
MKAYGGQWSASCSGRFTPGGAPGTHWIRWEDLRAGLNDLKRKFLTLLELELRPLGRPARSQLLYRLRYPDSPLKGKDISLTGVKARMFVRRRGSHIF